MNFSLLQLSALTLTASATVTTKFEENGQANEFQLAEPFVVDDLEIPEDGGHNVQLRGGLPKAFLASDTAQDDVGAQWAEAHNTRRQTFHEENGKEFVALTWDEDLAADAQSYADFLCANEQFGHGMDPENDNQAKGQGENLYAASGGDIVPESVVKGWADNELENYIAGISLYGEGGPLVIGHYTAVMWRRTTAVGCGFATDCAGWWKNKALCRYSPAGNCYGKYCISEDWDKFCTRDDSTQESRETWWKLCTAW